MSILQEKIAICQFCSGETFRESALDKLNNYYTDNSNFYYFILTDDKSYFKNVKRKNFFINEVKDFFDDYPLLEKNEPLIYAKDKNEYAKIFVETDYKCSFSLMRLHLLQALEHNITNVAMVCTDTFFDTSNLNLLPEKKDTTYNAVSEWDEDSYNEKYGLDIISKFLKENYNFNVAEKVRVLDAAGRLFRFSSKEKMLDFFNVWNHVIEYLYENNLMSRYIGSYNKNDEYILAPIYQYFGLNLEYEHATYKLFDAKHNVGKERFWRTGGSDGLLEHPNYEEFLKINNLNNG